jgi:hypothetical protein
MNRPPTDRPVRKVYTKRDDKSYHIWRDDEDGVTILVGCHTAELSTSDALRLGEAIVMEASR